MHNGEKITSVTNTRVKKILELQTRRAQKEQQLFLVEGFHLVEEAYKADSLVTIIFTDDFINPQQFDVEQILVSDEVIKKLCDVKTPTNIIGVCRIKPTTIDFSANILLLENIQDPGNLGTLIRSAKAFNFKTIICTPECVSFYNPKVVRSTQGNLFNSNLVVSAIEEVVSQAKEHNFQIIGTDLKKSTIKIDALLNKQLKLVMLGNEGSGLSPTASQLIQHNFVIEINPEVESLNVGVAGSIIMNLLNISNTK